MFYAEKCKPWKFQSMPCKSKKRAETFNLRFLCQAQRFLSIDFHICWRSGLNPLARWRRMRDIAVRTSNILIPSRVLVEWGTRDEGKIFKPSLCKYREADPNIHPVFVRSEIWELRCFQQTTKVTHQPSGPLSSGLQKTRQESLHKMRSDLSFSHELKVSQNCYAMLTSLIVQRYICQSFR